MELEKEKKLVAEKLMGWEKPFPMEKPDMFYKDLKDWNPQSERKCWPELFGKIDTFEKRKRFMDILSNKLHESIGPTPMNLMGNPTYWMWEYVTIEENILWESLVEYAKTLEEK